MSNFVQALAHIEELTKQMQLSEKLLDQLSWKAQSDELKAILLRTVGRAHETLKGFRA